MIARGSWARAAGPRLRGWALVSAGLRISCISCISCILCFSFEAMATEATPAPATSAPATSAPAPATAEAEPETVRRDPTGRRGISPFWEELRAGDRRYLVRDYAAALVHYRQAASLAPKDSEGHLRMAEAQIALGELQGAKQSLEAALRFASGGVARARAAFLLADLAERRGAPEEALAAWRAYAQLAEASPDSGQSKPGAGQSTPPRAPAASVEEPLPFIHVPTAESRVARIEARQKALEQYGAVRARIEKRLQEAEQASSKSP